MLNDKVKDQQEMTNRFVIFFFKTAEGLVPPVFPNIQRKTNGFLRKNCSLTFHKFDPTEYVQEIVNVCMYVCISKQIQSTGCQP